MSSLGLGIGWRPQLAPMVLHRADLGFVEILAESFPADRPLPLALVEARRRGVAVIPHGVGLGLGGAEVPDPRRLDHLGRLAERVGAPLVSEHIAFVRAGGREAGHLLPIPRTRAALDVLVENVRIATEVLPVPLALEPVASLFEWPDPEVDEATFLTELVERTGVFLLLDVANVYANARNHGYDPMSLIERLPLDRVAYIHVAGGSVLGGMYHDTHTDAVPAAVLDLLAAVASRTDVAGAMLERDDRFPPAPVLGAELDAIVKALGSAPWWPLVMPPSLKATTRPRHGLAAMESLRADLAVGQCNLLNVLLGETAAPHRFDAHRFQVAASALACKRARNEHGAPSRE